MSARRSKVSASADWSQGRWGATARATYYASVLQPGSTSANDYSTGDKTTIDLEGRFQITDRVGLAIGVDNVFDEYPDFAGVTALDGRSSHTPWARLTVGPRTRIRSNGTLITSSSGQFHVQPTSFDCTGSSAILRNVCTARQSAKSYSWIWPSASREASVKVRVFEKTAS